ncbi:palmitoyltransferase pfa5 [Xylographa bjoerkii]|nr:palmitoyltransferase pfa5 [Xylographa bjoerkii]
MALFLTIPPQGWRDRFRDEFQVLRAIQQLDCYVLHVHPDLPCHFYEGSQQQEREPQRTLGSDYGSVSLAVPFRPMFVLIQPSAGLFTFFTLGMSLSSLQFVLLNTTSVENLSRQTKIWTLAVHISRPPTNPNHKPFQTITYPLTPPPPGTPSTPPKTFAILHSKPGENPYNLGYYGNFKSVMGNNVFDWLVPLRYSPCCDHDSGESAFALGPVVQRMCEEAGLSPAHEGGKRRERQWGDISPERDGGGKHQRHRRRRRSRRQSGSRRKPRESAPVEQEAGERSDVAGSVIEHEDDEVVVR